jgi:glycosyltransferase involved in cell wall biosynthesis
LTRLLIGVPARNEADRIVDLADRIEVGADMLGASYESRLVLAYQASSDDTLDRFTTRSSTIPQLVVQSPHARQGKGANVKLLVQQALDDGVDFLALIDADLGGYEPRNLGRVVDAAVADCHSLVLPLWCRPQHQGNTTNYLASPLIFATRGARVRQPLAGHMLLHRSLLERLDLDALPDDYGIDITITLRALDAGLSVGQVPLVSPAHPSKEGNSERVMLEVASSALRAVSRRSALDRGDVCWPERYWDGWEWPQNGGVEPDHIDVILQHAGSESDLESWLELSDAGDDEIADVWCDHLADAVRAIRSPDPDLPRIVDDLVCPFFVHAEHRARQHSTVEELELYVADLGLRLAARLHG